MLLATVTVCRHTNWRCITVSWSSEASFNSHQRAASPALTGTRDAVSQTIGVEANTPDQATTSEEVTSAKAAIAARLDRRFELLEAILISVAAILTAWSAFQATKWGGV